MSGLLLLKKFGLKRGKKSSLPARPLPCENDDSNRHQAKHARLGDDGDAETNNGSFVRREKAVPTRRAHNGVVAAPRPTANPAIRPDYCSAPLPDIPALIKSPVKTVRQTERTPIGKRIARGCSCGVVRRVPAIESVGDGLSSRKKFALLHCLALPLRLLGTELLAVGYNQ